MPTTYAHYRFGRDVLALLPPAHRERIEAHRSLFDIGLHGPDIFFYYEPLRKNAVSKVGYEMHDRDGGTILRRLNALSDGSDAAYAYLTGFLCHFALDSACHGYVDQMSALGVSHSLLETQLDRTLLVADGLDPQQWDPAAHILPTSANVRAVAAFYPQVTERHVEKALTSMVRCLRLLASPAPAKRKLLLTAVTAINKKETIGGMIMSDQESQACRQMVVRLRAYYEEILPVTAALITRLPDLTHPQYRFTFNGEPAAMIGRYQ